MKKKSIPKESAPIEPKQQGINLKGKRGPLVLLSIIIVILGFILIRSLQINQNFDNDQVQGLYMGTLYVDEHPMYLVNMTFDGKGELEGVISLEDENYEFDGDYTCQDNVVQISFEVNQTFFSLTGELQSGNMQIEGDLKMSYSSEDSYSGTFILTKATA